MKYTDFAILIIIVIFPFVFALNISQEKMIEANQLKIIYDEIITNAVKDAAITLLDTTFDESMETVEIDYRKIDLNLDKALWRFYQTMYLNFGWENDFAAQQGFFDKVPLKIACGYDGYYVNAWAEIYDPGEGKNVVREVWYDKKPYALYDDRYNIRIDFTLDEIVTVTDLETGASMIGHYTDFVTRYPGLLYFGDQFDSVRRQAIADNIRNDLNYHSQQNSLIALRYGIKYNFTLPIIDNTAINDICFVAFFQGLPLNGGDFYNTYALGNSQIMQRKKIYANDLPVNGKMFYHREGCPEISEDSIRFDSEREAAKSGYYPHLDCT